MHTPTTYVTTSWDDGHELDQELAVVLADHGFAATFYIAPQSAEIPPRRRLRSAAIAQLGTQFEIGSHTLTHPDLTRLTASDAAREISQGKEAAEQAAGRPVTSFCYPYGAYRAEHVGQVRAAGFLVARTIRRFCTQLPPDLLQMGTTTHAARYKADGWPVLRRRGPIGRAPIGRALRTWANWDVLARELFDQARACGGVYHLWGHSWEIEAHGDWSRLRSLLRYIADHDDVMFLTNAEVAQIRSG